MDANFVGWQRRPNPLAGFDAVAANKRAYSRYPGGKMLHEVIYETTDNLTRIDLRHGKDNVVDISVANAKMLERYKKQQEQTGFVVMALSDISLDTLRGQILTGFNTTPGMEVWIGGTFGAGANPALTAFAFESDWDLRNDAQSKNAQFRPRIREQQLKGGGAGKELELDNLYQVRDGSEWIRRLHLETAADNITRLQVKRDNETLADITREQMRFVVNRCRKAAQANIFHFDPLMFGLAEEMLNTANARHLKFVVTLDSDITEINALIESVETTAPLTA